MRNRRNKRFGCNISRVVALLFLPMSILTVGVNGAENRRLTAEELRQVSTLLRPKPQDQYQIPLPLEQSPNTDRPPEVDIDKLMNMMGSDFLPKFMSIERPMEHVRHPNGTLTKRHNKHKRKGSAHRDSFKKLLDGRVEDLPKNQPELRRILRRFLRKHTECRTVRYWRHQGDHFFPSWVKDGTCNQTSSCSIPPGLKCLPGNYKELKVLIWRCTSGMDPKRTAINHVHHNPKNQKCFWHKVIVPILNECTCRCKTDNDDDIPNET